MNVNPSNLPRIYSGCICCKFQLSVSTPINVGYKGYRHSVFIAQTSRDLIKIELSAARYIDFVVGFFKK